jgi:hypothetical protein
MNTRPEVTGRKFTAKRGVANRYGVVPRTIDRWVAAEVFPPADRKINTRDYWDEATLEAHDRAQTVATATGRKGEPKAPPAHPPPP